MTREEFIKQLDKKRYSYKIEGDKIIIISGYGGNVFLNDLTSLPPGVVFRNRGGVGLKSLTSIPPGVEFRNGGYVDLRYLTSLPPGVEFNNEGGVFLKSLTGWWFYEWKGNIEGIESNRLLNVMIKQGVFER